MCLDSTAFLIDDDAAVRDALSISLSMSGLKIEVYSSGKAFLDTYIHYPIHQEGKLLVIWVFGFSE